MLLKGARWVSLSVGVSVNIGKNGFKHPIDAKPYIAQNDYLLSNYSKYRDANIALYNQHMMDANTLAKLRAVLEAEGLLDQYGYLFDDKATGSQKTNERLSRKRAQYIFLQLQKRGIQKEQMKVFSHGGVNEHDRNEEDRNTKVSVYVE